MGPKKGKEPIDEENYWRTCIEEAALDEDSWKVKVVLIEAAGSDQDRIYLDKFESYAAEERRFVIKNICKTETIFMVNQLGGEKKVKDDNLRVFEEGQSYLKEKKDIPPDILALIVKHLILKMKSEYLFIKHQRLEVKEGIQRESTTMINRAEVRGTVNVKPPEPQEPPEPPAKGKKGAEIDEKSFEFDENKKFNTLLRVRGEEWRDKVYIDDYPTDGPNLYVAVTGFVEPNLAGWLVKIGIPLTAVVQIRIDPTIHSVPSSLFRASKRGQSQTEVLMEKSSKFWEELQGLRINKITADDYKNTAFIVFSPPYWDNESLSGSPDKIYDELCYLMYDIQDLTRQHVHYIDNMDIITIPQEDKDNRYQIHYNKLIDDFPLESVTPYLVLDSILQTVCYANVDGISSPTSVTTALTLNQSFKEDSKLQKAENLVKDVIGQLCKIDSKKKKYRPTYGEEYESQKNPIVIIYGDICKYNTFHLGNINLDNIVSSMLFGMPINKLWLDKNKLTVETEAKINFHVNVLLSCFDRTDLETAELNRLLHILACRKLYNNRSSLKKQHLLPTNIIEFKKAFLKRSILAEPLTKCSIYNTKSSLSHSFPSMVKSVEGSSKSSLYEDDETSRIKFLFDCPDISELVSASEITTQKPIDHMIDDFEFFEDFNGTGAFQILLEAFNNFNCVNYKYCEVTDCILLMFFNSYDKDGIAREEWRCHVSTPLCLQDFFDFILEEHFDWIQNEEKVYDESVMLKSMSEFKDSKDLLATKSCVENMEVDMELLMEGSLKYEEITQLEAASPEASELKSFSTKKMYSPPSTIEPDSKSSKKTKSPANLTPKFDATFNEGKTIEEKKKPFSGYDLGDRRVEVFGKDSIYFSQDGTKVSSFYSLLIPMNVEYVILNVVPGNSFNEFWMHKALGEFVKPEVIDICESFRITCKNQVNIYIKKQVYQLPLPLLNTSQESTRYKEFLSKSPDTSNMVQQFFENKSFHSFYVTWPNGLVTESVHEDNSPTLSHIKQYYTSNFPNLNEDMRCISLNGEVLIFKPSGEIEILKPDSSYIKITKCQKRIVCDEIEEAQSVASSDKSKKGKGKDKGKDKPSKSSSKMSKNALVEEEPKPIEYELFIEEFESIETNGLRQNWINGNTFDIEKLLIKTATDYCLGEIFSKRMDGTHTLLSKDGVHVVTFPNNTRIITSYIIEDAEVYPEWTEEEIEYLSMFAYDVEVEALKSKSSASQKSFPGPYNNSNSAGSLFEKHPAEEGFGEEERSDGYISIHLIYSVEHPNFTTITIDKSNGKICVESPNNCSVTFNNDKLYEFSLGPTTSATFNGENLNISYKACPECKSFTTCNVKITSEEISSVTQIQRSWLKMNDSFCKKIAVNEEGNINVIHEACCDNLFHEKDSIYSEEVLSSTDKSNNEKKTESIVNTNGKCRKMYEAKSLRFFVLRRELTCSELVHRALIDEYKAECRWKPWCSINQYDTFGDHRSLWSILCPIHLNETEKWLMDSKLCNKPKNLTYKDLKQDTGKGFYHWMRPYKRFHPKPITPNHVLPERLPRAYILRTLEQQWRDEEREQLKGAKEVLNAILRYRHVMEADSETILNIPIHDQRSEDERTTDEIVQAVAHKTLLNGRNLLRVYEDLKIRLKIDVQSRARLSITTEPLQPEDISIEGEMDEESRYQDELKLFEEERELQIKEAESADQLPSNLKRYWRRREEEFKEEQFYRYLLREGSVPPYFRNVLGGAIWWEMNNVTDDAVIKAERRKMKCVCAEEASVAPEQPPEN